MALPSASIALLAAIGTLAMFAPACAQSSSPSQARRLPSASAIAARAPQMEEPVWEDEAPRRPPPASTFRTICVRLCDGFYFPISFQTTRRGLEADAVRCDAKCGGAQLFFHANPGGNVASAISFTGLQYDLLPNAFRHLKARVPGCGCGPEPWTVSEQERHRRYEELEKAQASTPAPDNAASAAAPPKRGDAQSARVAN